MEWLGQLICKDIGGGKWKPIRVSRSGLTLSHLFFADNLVIFSKAKVDQALLLDGIIKIYYDFSRHRISYGKSNMFFTKGVEDDLRSQIS